MKRFSIIALIFLVTLDVFSFPLISNRSLNVLLDSSEEPVVKIALDMFEADRFLVSGTGIKSVQRFEENTLVVGTLGQSEPLALLVQAGVLDAQEVSGLWEAFQIQTLTFQDKQLLVVAGSDKRGTAYGLLELSRLMGVSPWVWWADSQPDKKNSFVMPEGYCDVQKPSVQYRGIFINDEDLGFMPWSTQTVSKSLQKGATGPEAYEKVFQLMLRLRINTLWPAMHECTRPFHTIEGNAEMAHKYGIVVGSSHCDPMLRIGGTEWDTKKNGDFNFLTNKNLMIDFWSERLREVGKYENLYTIGLRGLHDVGMVGPSTLKEKKDVLTRVFSEQRVLLKTYVDRDVTKIPQVFVPYKEVLSIYENGLEVPDDVTLMWCDDNFGYMTRFGTPEEQKRTGGAGVYYHISYLGRPHQYIWLSGTQPALVYWQMRKAWDTGARRMWILNVGDIKPAEYDMEFYFDMAWNIKSVHHNTIYQHLENWLKREFGATVSHTLANVRNEYYRLSHIRRPEFMGWSRQEEPGFGRSGRTPVSDTEFKPWMFGDQIYRRIKDYEALVEEVMQIEQKLPPHKKDAYFQLVKFPVCASAFMNQKLLYAQKARLYAKYDLPVANEYANLSNSAYYSILDLVDFYNKKTANGKWDGIMWHRAWGAPVYEKAPLPDFVATGTGDGVLLWPENMETPVSEKDKMPLIALVEGVINFSIVSVFSYDGEEPVVEILKVPKWLTVRLEETGVQSEKRLLFELNPEMLKNRNKKGTCFIDVNGKRIRFDVLAQAGQKCLPTEHNGMVVINANTFISGGASHSIQGLGYTMNAVQVEQGSQNALHYSFVTSSVGKARISVRMLPMHPINSTDIRYAISVNGDIPKEISILTDYKNRDETWKQNVLRNQSVTSIEHEFARRGTQTITIQALDEGIVLDQLSVDFDASRDVYALPRMP